MPKGRLPGPARALIVSHEPLSNLVMLALNHGRFATQAATTVPDARAALRVWRPHLLLVDIDVDDRAAMELIGERVASRHLPTIAFTDRGDLRTKLAAFERGADDIVTLPFIPEELVARVLALMRRTYGDAVPFTPVITVGGLEIDLLNQQVVVGTLRPHLTTMEQALLYLLASNQGKTLGREAILDALWGSDYTAGSNVVDRHIRNLRVKLKDSYRRPRFIGTVPGKGYRFLPGV